MSAFFDGYDQVGRKLRFKLPARRVVSLVPSISQSLIDLGVAPVGLTKFCPPVTNALVVGGTKSIHRERVLSLAPDLILTNKEENTAEMVADLETGFPVFVTDIRSLQESQNLIALLGGFVGEERRAAELASNLRLANGTGPFRELRAAYLIWQNPFMAAGGGTFIDDMLHHCGFCNVFSQQQRYPQVSLQDLQEAQPDVLLLSSEPFPFSGKHADRISVQTCIPCHLVDGAWFSWYGTRISQIWDDLISWRSGLEELI